VTVRLPPGVRDLLPRAAARRSGIVSALTAEFARWGYRPIITPLYEYDEVLRLGLGGPAQALRLVEPSTGEVLALRPDLTAQVARLVATRLHDEPGPLRLFYEGSVVRLGAGATELFQVGVELIDAPQPGGDLEALSLAQAALHAAGVDGLVLDLGHADVAHAALEDLGLDEERSAALHQALAKKDASAVEKIAAEAKLPPKRQKLLAALPSLYGGAEVLARARALVEKKSPAARALDELEQLLERLAALETPSRVTLDLGEVRGMGYYTATRFAFYAEGAPGALVSGGRYDRLVERYGRAARATGFAVDVDRLAELLRARGGGPDEAKGGLLVAGDPVAAAKLAAKTRADGTRAILDLDEPPASDEVLRERAARQSLDSVAVCSRGKVRSFDVASRRDRSKVR
jgi:ATP phosphoribosyltransferase regulatory subunit